MPRLPLLRLKSNRTSRFGVRTRFRAVLAVALVLAVVHGAGAFSSHLDWLERNVGSDGDFERLDAAIEAAPNLRVVDDLMEKFADRLARPEDRSRAYRLHAELIELRGNTVEAEKRYREAFEHAPESRPGLEALIAAGNLALERGAYDEALEDAETVSGAGRAQPEEAGSLAEAALLLSARAQVAMEREREAFAELEAYHQDHAVTLPKTLLYKAELAARLGRDARRAELVERISDEFPDSPEARLASKPSGAGDRRVELLPSPAGLFSGFERAVALPEPETPREADGPRDDAADAEPRVVGVQTGSFSVKENAEYMVRDLREEGFSEAEVRRREVGDSTYYQVFVPVSSSQGHRSEAQRVVVELKELGFEGFLLFDGGAAE